MIPVTGGAQTWARARPMRALGLRRKIHGCAHRREVTARIAEAFSTRLFSRSTLTELQNAVPLVCQHPCPKLFQPV